MNTITVTIDRAGLTYIAIPVTAESTVELVQHNTGVNLWYALLIDGQHYDLAMWKHTVGRPELTEALNQALADVRAAIRSLQTPPTKPATTAAEYLEATHDANKARELHPSDLGSIKLDAFQAMTEDGRRAVWAAAGDRDRLGLALQVCRRKGHGPDAESIANYLVELDARFGPSPVERAVSGALERLAESHQRSYEGAETKEERTYFSRWAGAFRKAHFAYARGGIRPEPTESLSWLVPSATRAGRVHSVSRDGHCTCEAQNRGCWHSALVTGIETAGDDLDRFDGGDGEEEADRAAGTAARTEHGRRLCAARSRVAA